jgi:aquaporin SIP
MERNKMVVVSDFVLSFMWVCSSVLLKTFVKKVISINHSHVVEIVKIGFSIANMFFYAFLAKVFRGGANNPLATLVDAISGDFHNFVFCIGSRIPAQVNSLLLVDFIFQMMCLEFDYVIFEITMTIKLFCILCTTE